jgi:nucleotide-binding universal stress UspA family protein
VYTRILVAIDSSVCSAKALDESVRLVRALGAQLCIAHVADEGSVTPHDGLDLSAYVDTEGLKSQIRSEAQGLLDGAVASAAAAGCQATPMLVESARRRVADVIVEAANDWRADLVVIGTHGRRGFERLLLGSVAENLVRVASTSLMLVREDGSAATEVASAQTP